MMLFLHKLHLRTCWPRSVKSMLPRGSEDTLQSIIVLLSMRPDTSARSMLCGSLTVIMMLARPVAVPILIGSPTVVCHG
jgi:hypothetical protein